MKNWIAKITEVVAEMLKTRCWPIMLVLLLPFVSMAQRNQLARFPVARLGKDSPEFSLCFAGATKTLVYTRLLYTGVEEYWDA